MMVFKRLDMGMVGFWTAVVACCGLALAHGVKASSDLLWPWDWDLYRNVGQAQAMVDGHWFADPIYAGAYAWCNPLGPALVACLSRLAGCEIPLLYARAGAYLNILGPLLFVFLVKQLTDRWTAIAALLALLMIVSRDYHLLAGATYSPWLFSSVFAQAGFYGTLLLYIRAVRTEKRRTFLGTGVLWGLTFLCHTAPAVVLGLIMFAHALVRSFTPSAEGRRTQAWLRFGGMAFVAFVVGLPFTWPILVRYHLKIVNPGPILWTYGVLDLDHHRILLRMLLKRHVLLSALGLLAFCRLRQPKPLGRALVLLWLLSSAGMLGFDYLGQWLAKYGVEILRPVPSCHFLFYLKAVEAVLFGRGLMAVCSAILAGVTYMAGLVKRPGGRQRAPGWVNRVIRGAAVTGIFLVAYPGYGTQADFVDRRRESLQTDPCRIAAYSWICSNTRPDNVFLTAGYEMDICVVYPAARKLVATSRPFSNPYLDWQTRDRDSRLMLEHLRGGQYAAFLALASQYGVGYFLTSLVSDRSLISPATTPFLRESFVSGDITIYEVRWLSGS
jgi:hypothetical protein